MGTCCTKPKNKIPLKSGLIPVPQPKHITLIKDAPPQSVIKNQSGIQKTPPKEIHWQSYYNPQQGNEHVSFVTSIQNNQNQRMSIPNSIHNDINVGYQNNNDNFMANIIGKGNQNGVNRSSSFNNSSKQFPRRGSPQHNSAFISPRDFKQGTQLPQINPSISKQYATLPKHELKLQIPYFKYGQIQTLNPILIR